MSAKYLVPAIFSAAALVACGGSPTDQTTASTTPHLLATTTVVAGVLPFAGPRANYTVSRSGSSTTVTDKVGSGGAVTVPAGIGSLQFADVTVNLAIAALAASLAPADLKALVELYIAYFNRVPDADGLAYWIGEFKRGVSFESIGQSFYGAAISPAYSALTGYSASMSNADFLKVIYKNVLGRNEVDAGGMNYWTTALASGAETRGSLVKAILAAAHSFKGDATYGYVADLLDNKAAVGSAFAISQALTYLDATQSYSRGVAIAAAVTSSSTSAADALIAAIAPAVGSGGGDTGDSGSGAGNFADCFNPVLYASGTVYSIQSRSKSTGEASFDSTSTFTVTGPVAFKGNANAIEIRIATSAAGTNGADVSVKTYGGLGANVAYSYGGVITTTIPGFGSFTMTNSYTPAQQTPLNLQVNVPYTQTYTSKTENSSPLFPAQPDSVETSGITFLGTENVTVAAGTFAACKVKNQLTSQGSTSTTYSWLVAAGPYRGLTLKTDDLKGNTMEALKFSVNGS